MSDTHYNISPTGTTILEAKVGTSGVFYWSGFPNLDTGYTITIAGQTYTVGSGITLVTSPNTINWAFDFTGLSSGTYQGKIESDNLVLGVHFERKLKLILRD